MLSNPTLQSNTDFDVSLLEMLDIDIRPQDQLAPVAIHASHNPAAVYVASLAEGSRRTMIGALDLSARVLTRGACDAPDGGRSREPSCRAVGRVVLPFALAQESARGRRQMLLAKPQAKRQ